MCHKLQKAVAHLFYDSHNICTLDQEEAEQALRHIAIFPSHLRQYYLIIILKNLDGNIKDTQAL